MAVSFTDLQDVIMIDLDGSGLFTRIENEETGVSFYILTEKKAPLQQGFYFVNSGMTDDCRYLWFYCGFPPSENRSLGVIDFKSDEVRHFPQTQFTGASPFIDPETGEAYWCARESVWRMPPDGSSEPECVNSLPEEVVKRKNIRKIATHLTRSSDKKEFFIDAEIGLQWIMGSLPVDGGDFQHWHTFDRNNNHAQFSPTDPDLVLFAQEFHSDPITGLRIPITDRMHLIRRGEKPRPVFEEPTIVTHEWWDNDGKTVWCCARNNEAWRVDIESGKVVRVEWPEHCWHAHNTLDNAYMVCDSNEKFYRGCPSRVYFKTMKTGRDIKIADNPEMTGVTGAAYHIDPHPRFCGKDEYITFTVTIRDEVDLAIARTADLAELTS